MLNPVRLKMDICVLLRSQDSIESGLECIFDRINVLHIKESILFWCVCDRKKQQVSSSDSSVILLRVII